MWRVCRECGLLVEGGQASGRWTVSGCWQTGDRVFVRSRDENKVRNTTYSIESSVSGEYW